METSEDKDKFCRVGHPLTGAESRDCTRTLKCTKCARLYRKSLGMSNS